MSALRIVCPVHSLAAGGVERVGLRLCAAFADRGAQVTVALGRRTGSAQQLPPQVPIDTHPLGRWFGWCETLWMIATLPALLLRSRASILFCPGNSYGVVAVAMKLLLGRRCPPIVLKISNTLDRRDLPPGARALYRLWCRVQGRAADRIVAISPAMVAEAERVMAVPPGRIAVIANPILTRAQLDQPSPSQDVNRRGRRFVTVARLVPQKDLALAIRAFATAAGPHDRLTIAGDGPLRDRLSALAARLDPFGRIAFAGHVDDIGRLLREHDVLLLSSRYEGLPAAVAEALAAGLQVVATDCSPGLHDLLADGLFGTLVPVGDRAAFAAALRAPPAPPPAGQVRRHLRAHTIETAAPILLSLFETLVVPAPARVPAAMAELA